VDSVVFTLAAVRPSAANLAVSVVILQRGLIGQVGQADIGQLRLSRGVGQNLVAHLGEGRGKAAGVLHFGGKAGGLTQTAHDGRLQSIEFQIAEAADGGWRGA
jgi:hypothetical protein